MANTPPHFMANGDIRPSRFVKIDATADNKALEADANERVIGVSFEGSNYPPLSDLSITVLAAQQGQYFRMYGSGDVCLLEAGDAITAGDRLKPDADGRGVKIATTGTTIQHFGAMAMTDAAAAGELIRVFLDIGSERPALA